ncbi:MAG TPA: carboxylesterase family protein [Paludibaculum sp.]|jgi:para-nitrobenzyl esterase
MTTKNHPTNRRRFLAQTTGAAAAASILLPRAAQSEPTPFTAVLAKTTHGSVRGARANGVTVFKGIPYAGAPSGEHRFKAPPKLQPWTGVREAFLYGAQAIQPPDPGWPKDWTPAPSSEDCLFLNIWTQGVADGRKRPVMFYSHGGGFATGNGGADVWPQQFNHDGSALAKDYDVVVVTHNHRLGLMGYLYLGDLLGEEYAASGAAGMLDINAALQWVHDNIADFGGDPDNVMIWGESGGGAKTTTLTAMPSAQGLYHKASVESGPTLRLTPRDAATETTRTVLRRLGLAENQARQLLQIPTARFRELEQNLSGNNPMRFGPVVDGHIIPAHPYDPVAPAISAKIPMIIGTNKDETIMFFQRGDPAAFSLDEAGLRKRLQPALGAKLEPVLAAYRRSRPKASPTALYIAITTAQFMGTNAITMAERKVALHAAPVFMYIFAYESEVLVSPTVPYPQKAAHAMEMAFKFNHPDNNPSVGQRPERYQAARNMSAAWAAFARTSNPSHPGIPRWPAYTPEQRATMILDAKCQVVNDPYAEERKIWKELA